MRYALFGLALLIFASATVSGQETKKAKDTPSTSNADKIAGKTFEQWAAEIHALDPTDREIAIKTIGNFGPDRAYEAVPAIIKELKKHSTAPVDLSVRVNATIFLGNIFHYVKDPETKHIKETVALFKIGLKDDQAILKIRTLQALPYLGPAARDALPEVVKAIKDFTTWETRKEAMTALMLLAAYEPSAGPPAGALQALYGRLEDSSAIVRHGALQALVTMGQISEPKEKNVVLGKLEAFLKKKDKNIVMIEAHRSIINLKRKSDFEPIDPVTRKEHLDPIEAFARNADPTTRLNALMAISSIGPVAAPATTTVANALNDPDSNLSLAAMETLVRIRAYSAIPLLNEFKLNPKTDKVLKESAEVAIEQLQYYQKEIQTMNAKEKKKTDKK